MSLPIPLPQTTANPTTPNMREIAWVVNLETGYYDIVNSFTSLGNTGNLEVIKSKILITLNTFQGEWASQPDFGIPFNTLKAYSDDPNVVANIITDQILRIENIRSVSLNNFDYISTTRQFTADINAVTIYGENVSLSIGE